MSALITYPIYKKKMIIKGDPRRLAHSVVDVFCMKTEAMLLFFSAVSLFFMVCQLLVIIPKNRGNRTDSRSDKEIRDER